MRFSRIKVLLLGLWGMAAAQQLCPPTCTCSQTAVSCMDQNLEDVPDLQALDYSPMVLDFSGNSLLYVSGESFDFPNNDEVKEIYLNSSDLTEIAEGTFTKLEGLQGLYLEQNALSTVPENLIEGLDNMLMLDLSSNYINGALPTIRSQSLEVLAFIDSKVLSIPSGSLSFLPSLKLLLLQQNSIQKLSIEPFQGFQPNAVFVNLLFNAWTCSCDNLEAFHQLSDQKFIDSSEPYQCTNSEDDIVNVFEAGGELCDGIRGQEVREMVHESVLNTTADNYLEPLEGNTEGPDNEAEGCWGVFSHAYSDHGFFEVVLITTAVSFLLGFFFGVISCKILYTLRYKKLEQSSDSQVQLL